MLQKSQAIVKKISLALLEWIELRLAEKI